MALFSPQQLAQHAFCPHDYEQLAEYYLEKELFAYLSGGSGQEQSLADNRQAFQEIQLNSRLLNDVSHGNSELTLLNQTLAAPILLAPVAYQNLVDPQGEIASASAAKASNIGSVLSTLSSQTLEDVAQVAPACRVFQLYLQADDATNLDLINRAAQAGYQAIMITLDTSVQSVSLKARRLGFDLHQQVEAANLRDYNHSPTPTTNTIFNGLMAQAPNWQTFGKWIEQSPLPVWVKGVMHPDDAKQLKEMGVTGLVVSNHGGRALDSSPSPLRVLPAIRQAVGNDFTLLMDSGIRDGYDLFKALALGANAVMLGRLQIYSLAVGGAVGVAHMLKLIIEELQLCMALTGCSNLAEITVNKLFNPPSKMCAL
ncbi:alpha-hydroxy acid oxidase [Thiomicrorhabdus sp. Kp2]|uniref:alpha-hydroxy acid oxidase n=1 Tax=Thiomicrorhabdus sp. Kp2 TaxID=1123518 RepID=UPI000406871E|nr:alpha-hydroxy acid oxidase [Thiomicrorhabdus sp. Kp2]